MAGLTVRGWLVAVGRVGRLLWLLLGGHAIGLRLLLGHTIGLWLLLRGHTICLWLLLRGHAVGLRGAVGLGCRLVGVTWLATGHAIGRLRRTIGGA